MDVITKAIVVLDSPHSTLLCHANIQNLHYHEQVATKAGKLCTNDEIIFLYSLQKLSQLSLVIRFRSTDGFLNLTINHEFVAFAEFVDFKTLVLYCLSVAADSNVTVNHNYSFVKFKIINKR